MERIPLSDRYTGSLVGSAVGDAIGQPVEFMLSDDEIVAGEEKYGKGVWSEQIRNFKKELQEVHGGVVREMLVNPFGYWQKGEYTDDARQTFLLVDSIIEKGTYDPDDFVSRLLTWFDNGNAKGLGGTTKTSLTLIAEGVDWKEAGKRALTQGGTTSNGSLMRTSPVGLYLRGYSEDIDQVAAELSSITHATKPAQATCQMMSQLVAHLASGIPKYEAMDLVKNRYGTLFDTAITSTQQEVKNLGGAYESFSIALVSFGNAESFEEAIVTAVNQRGDTDTYGTVTGALAGAFWGVAQIPERWTQELNPLNTQQIAQKAENLYFLNEKLSRTKNM